MAENNTPFLHTAHRPWPMPQHPWRLRQRWSRLLFAHWPIRPAEVQDKLPRGLQVDTLDGSAWLGVVPFMMDRVRFRTVTERAVGVPSARAFPELNLRTYVTGPDGRAGVYFFSLDAASLLAVVGARIAFGLPYFWASMQERMEGDTVHYSSRRLVGPSARFAASFRSLHRPAAEDDLRRFLTERYALFTRRFGGVQIGGIHHAPWQLEEAEAEIQCNELPGSFGFTLPDCAPVLHYSESIEMQAWLPRNASAPPRGGFTVVRASSRLSSCTMRGSSR